METRIASQVRAAEVVLSCGDLDETVAFFCAVLGFRIDAISPADAPSEASLSGHGLRLRLRRGEAGDGPGPGALRLLCRHPVPAGGATRLIAPNGTLIELIEADQAPVLPPLEPALVVSRMTDGAAWSAGRAGMLYRDLIPGRQGGRFIASHIRIEEGGPVPDQVHYHQIRFQMIYCYKGWVRLVYEDQGAPFVLEAGDCVLQPPRIRHRVLESSPGLEVIEVSSPAAHETLIDHETALPTAAVRRKRDFGGQRFVWHRAAAAEWRAWRLDGFESRDLGIAAATGGAASAHVARVRGEVPSPRLATHAAELCFVFVLRGAALLGCEEREPEQLAAGDAFVVPAGHEHTLGALSADLELLEVTLPAAGGHH
jgi:quercetin dioxygenase-like cupin family protein